MKKELLFDIFAINYGCSNTSNDLLNSTRTLMVERNELRFRNAALIFIESAKKNDVDKMISMTSSISINRIGLNSAKEVYRNRVIPDFYGAITILRDTFLGSGASSQHFPFFGVRFFWGQVLHRNIFLVEKRVEE